MSARHFESIVLDYAEAAETPELLDNLSTVVGNGKSCGRRATRGARSSA